MADINLNIVGSADFSQIRASIQRLKTELAAMQAQYGAMSGPKLMTGTREAIHAFNQFAEASNKFRVHTVEATSAAERLSERIVRNRTNYSDLRMAMQGVNKEGNTFMQLGRRQQAMLDAQAIRVGKTAYVYENLAASFKTSAQMAMVNARAIAAQNAVLKEHAVNIINAGKNAQWTGRQLTMGLTMPIVMFGASAARVFNDVDKNLTRLAKVYGVGLTQPTEKALRKIRQDVIALSNELGKALGISANEVSDIAAQFAAAGLQGEKLIAATKQAARIVVLGEADKQEAINATISLQTAYKLNTQELTEAVNFFNAAQAATSTSMGDLINAIPRVGPIIKGLGGTYKDMVAILTALKEGGVPAGEAANAIKNSLGRIINPTEAAKKALKGFGIDIENIVNKNAGNLTGTLMDLQKGLKNLDSLSRQRAISEMFGKYQFARMAAFIENFNTAGSQSATITKMMGKSAVELANIAETQTKRIQQSASGRFKIAVESMKNSLIPLGETFLQYFGFAVEKITELMKAIKELPGPIKTFLKVLTGITTIVGPMVMVIGLFGNMFGSIAKGLITMKQFIGATRSLFTGGGFAGFKTIISGFRNTDLVADAAAKAITVFSEKSEAVVQSATVFDQGISMMIASLQELNKIASVTGNNVNGAASSAASAAARAAAAMGGTPSRLGGNIKDSGVYGVSYHHVVGTAMTTGAGRSRENILSTARILPAQYGGDVNKVFGEGSIIYRTQAEKEAILKQAMSHGSYTPAMAPLVSQVPISLQSYAKEIGAFQATLKGIESLSAAELRTLQGQLKEISASASTFGEKSTAATQAALNAIRESASATQVYETTLQERVQFITTRFNEETNRLIATGNVPTQALTQAAVVIGRELNAFEESLRHSIEQRAVQAIGNAKSATWAVRTAQHNAVNAQLIKAGTQFNEGIQLLLTGAVRETASSLIGAMAISSDPRTILPQLQAQGRVVAEVVVSKSKAYLIDVTNGLANATGVVIDRMTNSVVAQLSASATSRIVASPIYATKVSAAVRAAEQQTKVQQYMAEQQRITQQTLAARSGLEYTGPKGNLTPQELAAITSQRVMLQSMSPAERTDYRNKIIKENAARERAAFKKTPEYKQQRLNNLSRGLGATGLMASMGMMYAGGNEFATAGLMGVSMGAMVPSMLMGTSMAAFAGPIAAIVAAIPLIIKGTQALIDNASKLNRAMSGAFSVSAGEADILGIKIHKIGQVELPKATEEASKTASKIESMVSAINGLSSDDPLKSFVDSLKSNSVQDQMQLLQQKYLTLRIQGVNDEEARGFVRAIMRAAGVEMGTTYGVSQFMVASQNQSVPKMIGIQAQSMVNVADRANTFGLDAGTMSQYLDQFAGGGLGMGPSLGYGTFGLGGLLGVTGPGADAARKAVESFSQTINDLLTVTPATDLPKLLNDIEAEMSTSADTANLYKASIRELFQQSGPAMQEFYNILSAGSADSSQKLEFVTLAMNGLIRDIEDVKYLSNNPLEIDVRFNYLKETQQLGGIEQALSQGLSKNAKSTTYTVPSASVAIAQSASDAQQSIVDKLKAELDIRTKINDAQEKSLQFASSQASLQQQYNEALASNDMAKAADIQRQMRVEQGKYNNELEKTKLQDNLDREQNKLSTLQKTLSATQQSAKDSIENISSYTSQAMNIVYKALADGKTISEKDLNSLAIDLRDKFGVPIADTKRLIQEALDSFDSNGVMNFATNAANSFNTKWIPAQKKAAILAAFNSNVTTQGMTQEDAMASAIQTVVGGEYGGATVRAQKTSSGAVNYIMTVPTGKGSYAVNVSTAGVISKTPSPTYAPPTSNNNTSSPYPYPTPTPGMYPSYPSHAEGGYIRGYAERGYVSGPGTGTSDSILARLSNGEFVMKANAVKKYGTGILNAMNNSVPTFADGGYVRGYRVGGQVHEGGSGTPWYKSYLNELEKNPVSRLNPNAMDSMFLNELAAGRIPASEMQRFSLATGISSKHLRIPYANNLANTVVKDLMNANRGLYSVQPLPNVHAGVSPQSEIMSGFLDKRSNYDRLFNMLNIADNADQDTVPHEMSHFLSTKWLAAGTTRLTGPNRYMENPNFLTRNGQIHSSIGYYEEVRAQLMAGMLDRLAGNNSTITNGVNYAKRYKSVNIWDVLNSSLQEDATGSVLRTEAINTHTGTESGRAAYFMGYGNPEQVADLLGFNLPKGYSTKGLKNFPKVSRMPKNQRPSTYWEVLSNALGRLGDMPGFASGGYVQGAEKVPSQLTSLPGYAYGGKVEGGSTRNIGMSLEFERQARAKELQNYFIWANSHPRDSKGGIATYDWSSPQAQWSPAGTTNQIGSYLNPKIKSLSKDAIEKGYQDFLYTQQMFDAMGQMGFSGVVSSIWDYAKNNPMDALREFTGFSMINRTIRQDYADTPEGRSLHGMDALALYMAMIPGIGLGGTALRGAFRGSSLGLRGLSLAKFAGKEAFNVTGTKALLDISKGLYGFGNKAGKSLIPRLNPKNYTGWRESINPTNKAFSGLPFDPGAIKYTGSGAVPISDWFGDVGKSITLKFGNKEKDVTIVGFSPDGRPLVNHNGKTFIMDTTYPITKNGEVITSPYGFAADAEIKKSQTMMMGKLLQEFDFSTSGSRVSQKIVSATRSLPNHQLPETIHLLEYIGDSAKLTKEELQRPLVLQKIAKIDALMKAMGQKPISINDLKVVRSSTGSVKGVYVDPNKLEYLLPLSARGDMSRTLGRVLSTDSLSYTRAGSKTPRVNILDPEYADQFEKTIEELLDRYTYVNKNGQVSPKGIGKDTRIRRILESHRYGQDVKLKTSSLAQYFLSLSEGKEKIFDSMFNLQKAKPGTISQTLVEPGQTRILTDRGHLNSIASTTKDPMVLETIVAEIMNSSTLTAATKKSLLKQISERYSGMATSGYFATAADVPFRINRGIASFSNKILTGDAAEIFKDIMIDGRIPDIIPSTPKDRAAWAEAFGRYAQSRNPLFERNSFTAKRIAKWLNKDTYFHDLGYNIALNNRKLKGITDSLIGDVWKSGPLGIEDEAYLITKFLENFEGSSTEASSALFKKYMSDTDLKGNIMGLSTVGRIAQPRIALHSTMSSPREFLDLASMAGLKNMSELRSSKALGEFKGTFAKGSTQSSLRSIANRGTNDSQYLRFIKQSLPGVIAAGGLMFAGKPIGDVLQMLAGHMPHAGGSGLAMIDPSGIMSNIANVLKSQPGQVAGAAIPGLLGFKNIINPKFVKGNAETVALANAAGENAFFKTFAYGERQHDQALAEIFVPQIYEALGLNAPKNILARLGENYGVLSPELRGFDAIGYEGKSRFDELYQRAERFKYYAAEYLTGESDAIVGSTYGPHPWNVLHNPETGQLGRIDFSFNKGPRYRLDHIQQMLLELERLGFTPGKKFDDVFRMTDVPAIPMTHAESNSMYSFLSNMQNLDISRLLTESGTLDNWLQFVREHTLQQNEFGAGLDIEQVLKDAKNRALTTWTPFARGDARAGYNADKTVLDLRTALEEANKTANLPLREISGTRLLPADYHGLGSEALVLPPELRKLWEHIGVNLIPRVLERNSQGRLYVSQIEERANKLAELYGPEFADFRIPSDTRFELNGSTAGNIGGDNSPHRLIYQNLSGLNANHSLAIELDDARLINQAIRDDFFPVLSRGNLNWGGRHGEISMVNIRSQIQGRGLGTGLYQSATKLASRFPGIQMPFHDFEALLDPGIRFAVRAGNPTRKRTIMNYIMNQGAQPLLHQNLEDFQLPMRYLSKYIYQALEEGRPMPIPGQGAFKHVTESDISSIVQRIEALKKSMMDNGGYRYEVGYHADDIAREMFGGHPRYKNGGFINLPKYHTGGYVNYRYGGEVAAMLQGGEVVIPKEIVRDLSANNMSSVYNNNPNITVNVAGTNATPEQIANAVSQAIQTRSNMEKSRTVVRA